MADHVPLLNNDDEEPPAGRRSPRVASLDVFRGLSVFLMMLVDYGGSIFPIIAHSPWNGVHLADFVMPFFLFVVGVSLALVYKKVTNRVEATWKAVVRAAKLFLVGVLLQGGYLHGISSLTYGVDIERIRWFGILQRISVGYIVTALCEIWLSQRTLGQWHFVKSYYWHWSLAIFLSVIYVALSYGLYVPDWQFEVSSSSDALLAASTFYSVKCSVKGDLGPACNAAGMIDRYVIGNNHLYAKPVYRNLKDCNMSTGGQVSENSPSWCHAPFDPEEFCDILFTLSSLIDSSLTAAVTCIIGLQYGHVLANLWDPKRRLNNWFLFSASLFVPGIFLALVGVPVNKSLYTVSYMLITSSVAGVTFCALYLLVDVYGYRRLTSLLEWMGRHSLSIFVLVTSNVAVIALQGFYWKVPENNIIHWTVTLVVRA